MRPNLSNVCVNQSESKSKSLLYHAYVQSFESLYRSRRKCISQCSCVDGFKVTPSLSACLLMVTSQQ